MIYKNFQDLKLSSLGFGTMRLPHKGQNGDTPIDEEETAKMVEYAIKNIRSYERFFKIIKLGGILLC